MVIIKKRSSKSGPIKFNFNNIISYLTLSEKLVILILLLVIAGATLGFLWTRNNGQAARPDQGGLFVEGVTGYPESLNPLYAESDPERDVATLQYSGLLKYSDKHELVGDIIDKWSISEDGKLYSFSIKNGLLWSDGQPITIEDIFFTITVTKDKDYKGPLASYFKDVEGAKKSNTDFELRLKKPFAPFIHNLTIEILPKHVWEKVKIADFAKSEKNYQPVVSGPYRLDQVSRDDRSQINQLLFSANNQSGESKPYMTSLMLKLYENQAALATALTSQEVMAASGLPYEINKGKLKRFAINSFKTSQFVALFFNQKNQAALADKTVRLAISEAINREGIVKNVCEGFCEQILGPILPGYLGYNEKVKEYSKDEARTLLDQAGWMSESGKRIKQGKEISFKITTLDDPMYSRLADQIKKDLSEIGINVTIEKLASTEIQAIISKDKNYEALLFGENIGPDPDVFDFWHSSKISGGYNLALFENAEADRLLEEARQTSDVNLRSNNYKRFQEIIDDKVPAAFIDRPYLVYAISKKIKGVVLPEQLNLASERFSDINNWFIKTK